MNIAKIMNDTFNNAFHSAFNNAFLFKDNANYEKPKMIDMIQIIIDNRITIENILNFNNVQDCYSVEIVSDEMLVFKSLDKKFPLILNKSWIEIYYTISEKNK